jgi:hypothetical protein
LINGRIYFHERQRDPSWYGGTIAAIERILEEGVRELDISNNESGSCE